MSESARAYERCAIFAWLAVLVSLALGATHIWRNVSDPAGELFNKHEWSLVQALEQRSRETAFSDSVATISNVLDSPDYDAIALPRLDRQGSVWLLSNAAGIPRVKLLPKETPRQICKDEYERIVSAVRLNSDVETLLQALTKPDCGE